MFRASTIISLAFSILIGTIGVELCFCDLGGEEHSHGSSYSHDGDTHHDQVADNHKTTSNHGNGQLMSPPDCDCSNYQLDAFVQTGQETVTFSINKEQVSSTGGPWTQLKPEASQSVEALKRPPRASPALSLFSILLI